MSFGETQQALNVGRTLGLVLHRVAQVKIGMALRAGDDINRRNALDFQKLYKAEWNSRVNSPAVKLINSKKRCKASAIPFTEDLQKLRLHIICRMNQLTKSVKQASSPDDWVWLAKYTISRLILFNKRWRAEVKDLKVKDYLERSHWQSENSGEMQLALSPVDQMLAKR